MTVRQSTCATADVDAPTLAAVRGLLVEVFGDAGDEGFTDADWDHTLGGHHVLAREAGEVVGHAALVCRRVLHDGRTLRCGYVEGVVVRADRRRRGIADALMAEVERLLAGFDVGALGATDDGRPLYLRRGWVPWRGRLSALTPSGVVPTPDEEGDVLVMALPGVPLDLDGGLTCDWRLGDLW
ncbi:GNAT family N-acetyltransferase [Nocardioides sp. CFH 31398]|uniref:GNAT family N-acetyltransferase n=1 Tax=Nocardioides sp. CFH 31398 TaxID=2919579 RepID=UPI001F060378|nr:GNAT family N-acetyltransferase [Nocardioides sp. CFH 31398]MCH1867339.1 GNAT family N-acetyltransferase [Nocardioides sp. CFH 31398]